MVHAATNTEFKSECTTDDLTIDTVISEVSGLVSPPSVCVRLYNLINSTNATAKDIGKTIELDPNLVARVLKIANSAAYSFPAQISSMDRAVTILGTQDLCNLVMAIAAVRSFSRFGGGLFTAEEFWRHSVFVGLCAKHLARQCKLQQADTYFIAGLLHDIGIPVLYSSRESLREQMADTLSNGETQLATTEQANLGYDHAEVGANVLKSWCLPDFLINAISGHHNLSNEPAAAVLHIADYLAHESMDAMANVEQFPDLNPKAWECLPVNRADIDFLKIVDKVNNEHEDAINAIIGK